MLLLYAPTLANWGSQDDLKHLRVALQGVPFSEQFFRPLERLVNELNVQMLGYDDLRLSLTVNLLGLLLTLIGTYVLGRELQPHATGSSLFAVSLLAVAPLTVLPSVQIDTISQQYATVFALFFFLALLRASQRQSRRLYVLAYTFALFALLSKETAPGVVAAAPLGVLIVTRMKSYQTARKAFGFLVRNYLGVAAVVVLYVALRFASGYILANDDSGQYGLAFSPQRTAKNLTLYFTSLFYAGGSSLDIFPTPTPWRVAVSSFFTLTLGTVSVVGALRVARSPGRPELLALTLLTLAGSFPVVLTEQVSELYVYSSLPFFALLVGLCFTRGVSIIAKRPERSPVLPLAAVFSLCLLAWLSFGSYEKIARVSAAADQSQHYFTQAKTFFTSTPDDAFAFCWSNQRGAQHASYSSFFANGYVLAGRTITFAAFLAERSFVIFSGNDVLASSTPASDLTTTPRDCTYQLELVGDDLRFQ